MKIKVGSSAVLASKRMSVTYDYMTSDSWGAGSQEGGHSFLVGNTKQSVITLKRCNSSEMTWHFAAQGTSILAP